MLVEGRIIAIGTPDEIQSNPDPRVQQFLRAGISHKPSAAGHLQMPARAREPVAA
jgi:ABC-type transporter Mla maintaining outer membrane lipid asymmetry ATPase subunit MlaF